MIFKNCLRSLAALGALAAVSVAPAQAADVYASGGSKDAVYVAAPNCCWQGFYIGAHVGGAWGNNGNHENRLFFDDRPDVITGLRVDDGVFFNDPNRNGSGVFGGVQFGYNFQGGSNCCFVYGIEVDVGGLDNGNKDRNITVIGHPLLPATLAAFPTLAPPFIPATTFRFKNDGGLYGDVTARLGYTFGSALLYVKGGFAFADTNNQVTEAFGPFVFGDPNNNGRTNTGWTIGGGLEYMLGTNWTIKAEYLHFDFGNQDRHCCSDFFFNDFRFKNDLTVDTVKVGINYLIRPTAVALPYK